jgi:hypothetical protein
VYHQRPSGGTPSTAGDCIFVVNSGGSQARPRVARLQSPSPPSPQVSRCCAANDCSSVHPSSPQATEGVDAEGDQEAPPPPGRHPQGPEPTEVPALVYRGRWGCLVVLSCLIYTVRLESTVALGPHG